MSTKNECCERCGKHVRDRSFIGSGSSRGSMTGVHVECKKPDCPCHQISSYEALVEVAHSDGFAGAGSPKPTESWEEAFIETGASLEHERWAKWQKYVHSKCVEHENGTGEWVCFPSDSFRHWERQISTPYAELSEQEKESDRRETRTYLPLIKKILHSQREELCGRLEGLRKRHKEFECNKAYGGRGCFETFCEDQECQNAPKEYNQAIDDAIKAIKSSTKNLSGNLAEEIIDEIIEETIVQAIKNND